MADEKVKEEAVQPAETEAAEQAPKQEKSSKVGLFVVIGIALAVVVVTPLVTVLVVRKMTPAPVVEVEAETENGSEIILPIDPIIVNIAETKGTRILKIEPHLVVSEARLATELKDNYKALLSDRIILAASRKNIDELEGAAGREALKREIMSEINAAIRKKMSGAVTDIYFKEFLIQ